MIIALVRRCNASGRCSEPRSFVVLHACCGHAADRYASPWLYANCLTVKGGYFWSCPTSLCDVLVQGWQSRDIYGLQHPRIKHGDACVWHLRNT